MTVERVRGLRLAAFLVSLALFGAACGGSATTSTDDGSDDSEGSESEAGTGDNAGADEDGGGDSADATSTDDQSTGADPPTSSPTMRPKQLTMSRNRSPRWGP